MPIPTKDIIFRLVDRIEEMYIENFALRAELLEHVHQATINERVQEAKSSQLIKNRVAQGFVPIRVGLIQEALEEQGLIELLRAAPPIDVKNTN